MTLHIFLMAGVAAFFQSKLRKRYCVATFSYRGGIGDPSLTESDIFGPSHAFCQAMDDFSCTKDTASHLTLLATIH